MSDDPGSLSAVWTSDQPMEKEKVMSAITAVLHNDRADRERERRIRLAVLLALTLLVPAMLWGAAHGVTPLVRGAFALMAAGSAMIAVAEWMYLEWSHQALPGPTDTRSQLQQAAFVLTRQVRLLNTASIWSAPVFIGVALIGVWLYRERTHVAAFVVWTTTVTGWLVAVAGTTVLSGRLKERKVQMERFLSELE